MSFDADILDSTCNLYVLILKKKGGVTNEIHKTNSPFHKRAWFSIENIQHMKVENKCLSEIINVLFVFF